MYVETHKNIFFMKPCIYIDMYLHVCIYLTSFFEFLFFLWWVVIDGWPPPGPVGQEVRRWSLCPSPGCHPHSTLKLGTKTHKLWQAQSPQLPSLFYLFHELSLQCKSGALRKLVCTCTSLLLICKVINITIILNFMHHYSCQRWGSINQPFFFNPL